MIRIILSFVLILISFSFFAQNKNTTKINVSVNNMTTNKGFVAFQLFEEDGFLKTPIQTIKGRITDGKTAITFKNVINGTYSIVCFHDVNENGKIDFNQQGIPLEDIGATNSKIMFGPPSFEKSKFTVNKQDLYLTIKF